MKANRVVKYSIEFRDGTIHYIEGTNAEIITKFFDDFAKVFGDKRLKKAVKRFKIINPKEKRTKRKRSPKTRKPEEFDQGVFFK